MEVIKTHQGHPNSWKLLDILTIPKAKLNLALKMVRKMKSFRKLKSVTVCSEITSRIKKRTIYKQVSTSKSHSLGLFQYDTGPYYV